MKTEIYSRGESPLPNEAKEHYVKIDGYEYNVSLDTHIILRILTELFGKRTEEPNLTLIEKGD